MSRTGHSTGRFVDVSRRIGTGILPNLRSFVWAFRQTRSIRRQVREVGVDARVAAPTTAGPRGWWGVRGAIAVTRPTCLQRALVLQSWLGSYVEAPDVVIGVRRSGGEVEAHAWVDGQDPWYDPSYEELTRLPA